MSGVFETNISSYPSYLESDTQPKFNYCGIAIGIIFILGSVFVTLADYQILPGNGNVISDLGIFARVLGDGLLVIGVAISAIFGTKSYLAGKVLKNLEKMNGPDLVNSRNTSIKKRGNFFSPRFGDKITQSILNHLPDSNVFIHISICDRNMPSDKDFSNLLKIIDPNNQDLPMIIVGIRAGSSPFTGKTVKKESKTYEGQEWPLYFLTLRTDDTPNFMNLTDNQESIRILRDMIKP
jgi:hypothetical protein